MPLMCRQAPTSWWSGSKRPAAIVIGKSNTPEFGAGANSYNQLFEATRTPWRTDLTSGGSSGGSAAALAAGQAWLATGSDLGGSLRTPASFCGVVGLQAQPGAGGQRALGFSLRHPLRQRADGAQRRRCGADAGCHGGTGGRGSHVAGGAGRNPSSPRRSAPRLPRRVAYSPDLGICRVAPAVREVTDAAMALLAGQGVDVVPATPDLSDAPEIFKTLRAAGFAAGLRQEYEEQRHQLKPEVVWNIEHGRSLTAEDIGRAERARGQLYHRMRGFMRDVDLLLVPAAILPPFDVETRWIREWEGVVFENYVEWIRITYAITLSALPVLCIPCGLTPQGLPIGLQLVGKPRGEAALLAAGAALEAVFGLAGQAPDRPRAPSGSLKSRGLCCFAKPLRASLSRELRVIILRCSVSLPISPATLDLCLVMEEKYGYYLEDLELGMTAIYAKTVTEADVVLFAGISGDINPVHLDNEFAKGTMFKGRIAHGMLTASFISTVLGTNLPGPGCIYVSQNLKFRAPVRIGDTVRSPRHGDLGRSREGPGRAGDDLQRRRDGGDYRRCPAGGAAPARRPGGRVAPQPNAGPEGPWPIAPFYPAVDPQRLSSRRHASVPASHRDSRSKRAAPSSRWAISTACISAIRR